MTFCRLGGLSPVDHKNKKNKFTFHFPPPVKKGIYAFVWPYIELFLVMWCERNIKELDVNGFRKFEYEGPIWSHHKSEKTVISRRTWYLTDTDHLKELLRRDRKESRKQTMEPGYLSVKDPYKRGSTESYTMSRDHLEVYIEKKYLGRIR